MNSSGRLLTILAVMITSLTIGTGEAGATTTDRTTPGVSLPATQTLDARKASNDHTPAENETCDVVRDSYFFDTSGGTRASGDWYFSAMGRCTVTMASIGYTAGVFKSAGGGARIGDVIPDAKTAGGSGKYSCVYCKGEWTSFYQVELLLPAGWSWTRDSEECTVSKTQPRLLICQNRWTTTL